MNGRLFRKSSLERISSPEQLNEYVRVSGLGVWMVLAAIIILLTGMCVWGIFGRLETRLTGAGMCKNGVLTCYVREDDIEAVRQAAEKGMTVSVSEQSFPIFGIEEKPITVSRDTDEYFLYLGGFQPGEWVYEIKVKADLADGVYEASMVTESVSPMSFLLDGV